MPLTATRNAIGEVTRRLAIQLAARTDATTVDVGRPEQSALFGDAGPKLNLFLYAFRHDAHMRNTPLDRGQDVPIWLCLKFLMTAVDTNRDSDSSDALDLLGQGMLALRAIEMQRPSELALLDNPEPIKISFDQSEVELLSSVMQGTDEHYRLSAAFEVRPVMLTTVSGTGGAPLIRTVGPPATPGVLVLPSMGPRLDRIVPESFEAGATVMLEGGDLRADQVEVCFGETCVAVPPADVTNRAVRVAVPATLSSGSHAVTLVRLLPGGRRQTSNAVLGRLRPVVTGAAAGALSPGAGGTLFGSLTVNGSRLGGPGDSIFAGFYGSGDLRLLVEVAGSLAQTALSVTVPQVDALPPGPYRILIRVNGEQAADAPEVNWT
ncbi:Pvc16 family protein [Rhodovulum euryhalinum]|uniref:Uncharacterized protein DUF4255 n=1 Tax=Rhodovulum euryhalinum TaxID=35805 RepID=A0A4R2KDA6_9RHOB|nr:Pvc16 family protein [Rhodovulum euryhalinum]TCO70117.1 uncharacterized protein DUF4255 [Rhodovulum euryhalinum]